MNKTIISLLALMTASSIVFSVNTWAQDEEVPYYVGLGGHIGEAKLEGVPPSTTIGARAVVGKYLSETVALEAQYVFGTQTDQVAIEGFNVDVKLKNIKSGFIRKDFILADEVRLFALAGWSSEYLVAGYEGKDNFLGIKATEPRNFHGLSFGGGINIEILWGLGIRVDYIRYESEVSRVHYGTPRFNYSGLNLGANLTF